MVFRLSVESVMLPAREGILIEEPDTLPRQFDFALTYPGSASMASAVFFVSREEGILLASRPSLKYTRLGIRSLGSQEIQFTIESSSFDMAFIPFRGSWKNAAAACRRIWNQGTIRQQEKPAPRFMLQIGIRDPLGNCGVRDFLDLIEPVEMFSGELGPGQIIHFYGANESGFDRMYPEMRISSELGGERAVRDLNDRIHALGLQTSHHFNPRLADYDYVRDHPALFDAAVRDRQGAMVMEPYAGHPFLVMNLSHPAWFAACLLSIGYLYSMGFDYVQLDQMTQQRNFHADPSPVHAGLARLLEEIRQMGKQIWLEGVSDVHRLQPPDFFQILVRDHVRLWPDGELASGYPWGFSCPEYFRIMHPDQPLSYRVMTDTRSVESLQKRLEEARRIGAHVYDLQMDYFHNDYMPLLKNVLGELKQGQPAVQSVRSSDD